MTILRDTLEDEQIDQIVIEFIQKKLSTTISDEDLVKFDLLNEMNALDRRQIQLTIDEYDSNLFEELVTKVSS